MSKNTSQKRFQQIIIAAATLALVGVGVFPFLGQLTGRSTSNSSQNGEESSVANQQLQAIEKGYEEVLKREPDNRNALQGLVQVRMEMNHFHSAKEPMEKLLQLEPENPMYLQALAEINLKVNDIDGALVPLEKLVKLYPERAELKTIVDTLKQAQKGEIPPSQPSPSNPLVPDPSIPIPPPQP